MKGFIRSEKRGRLFTAILIGLLLVGCARMPPLLYLKDAGAFLPTEQMLAQVNERHPNAHLLEVKFKQGKGSPFNRNYRYEIKLLARENRQALRALKIDAHDGRILSDEPYSCTWLKRCPWKSLLQAK